MVDALDFIAQKAALENRARVVCLGYDLGRRFETFGPKPQDDLNWPELVDFSIDDPRVSLAGSGWGIGSVQEGPSDRVTISKDLASPVSRSLEHGAYLAAVNKALAYIAAGDIYQVNLANRLHVPTHEPARVIFDRLVSQSPMPYSAMIDLGEQQLLCNSPELFLSIDPADAPERQIVNRPIKGTRPNLPGMLQELYESEKDQAELAMIVDLQRNDLGRVCEIGSVRVTRAREIETHSTVLHGVATVQGTLRVGVSFGQIIAATFPCGSITGCPKIRASQIIDELEPVARGPYCGAVGVVHPDGSAVFNVAIRSMVIARGVAHVYVGGGIVADSTPEAEWDETLAKARAMLAALEPGVGSSINKGRG